MNYTDEQFNELAKFDVNFFYAIKTKTSGNSTHPITRADLVRIAQIHREATGSKVKPTAACGECTVRVLRIVGTAYFADKDERAALEATRQAALHEIATSEQVVQPEKKLVKTASKSSKKKTTKKATK